MSLGIIELKEFVGVACDLGNVAGLSLVDGKINSDDITAGFALVKIFPALLAVDFSQAWKEIKDYTPAEHAELVEFLKKKLDLPQDKLEAQIEKIMDLSKSLYVAVAGLVDVIKSFKAV